MRKLGLQKSVAKSTGLQRDRVVPDQVCLWSPAQSGSGLGDYPSLCGLRQGLSPLLTFVSDRTLSSHGNCDRAQHVVLKGCGSSLTMSQFPMPSQKEWILPSPHLYLSGGLPRRGSQSFPSSKPPTRCTQHQDFGQITLRGLRKREGSNTAELS